MTRTRVRSTARRTAQRQKRGYETMKMKMAIPPETLQAAGVETDKPAEVTMEIEAPKGTIRKLEDGRKK